MSQASRQHLRRQLIALGAASTFPLPSTLWARDQPLRLTPSQTEGPYYPVREPKDADFDLLRNGALDYKKGVAAWVSGKVLDFGGKPLKGGTIEIWQCDEDGHYDHPDDRHRAGTKIGPAFQGFGRVVLNTQGEFRFRTIRPAAYEGRTPHIHAKIKLGRQELLTTQFYVEAEPGNLRDFIWSRLLPADRAAVTAPYVPVEDGLSASYQVVVKT